ncbi:hypothetical protein [Nonomuraea glycinis]|uniref:hypothetical protein n=1 Tax=Nonomuraea glycinis TaxID=2047744 RepID=UPI0033B71343
MVKDKLIKAVQALESGVTASETYTVRDAVNDWLSKALTRHQADAMLKAAESSELHAYVVLSLTQAGDHQGRPHHEHNLRRQADGSSPSEMAPRSAPIDFQKQKRA